MAADLVLSEIKDGVAVLTLNRPDRNNSWTIPLELELFDLLRQCERDPEVRVVVLTGAGSAFCPGLDTQNLTDIAAGTPTALRRERRPVTFPTTVSKPVIAAINGACAGIGLIAALTCDIRFAAAGAKFTTAFARRGIMAEHGIAWLLPRVVGVGHAMDLLLSGRVVLAEEALGLGLVNRVYPADTLLEKTIAYARDIAENCSPIALATMKSQVYQAQETSLETARQLALAHWHDRLKPHPDFAEGISSYVDRRPPSFQPFVKP